MEWQTYRMARDLAGTVFPASEAVILQAARKLGIGRKMGRVIIFSPEDCHRLYEALPCPSSSFAAQNRPAGLSGVGRRSGYGTRTVEQTHSIDIDELQAAAIVEADGKADDLAAWEEAMILAQAKFLLHMAAPESRGLLQI
jgi:hypothetical protein